MIALAVTVVALTRQIGILYERVAPAGALMLGQGLKVGETLPEFHLKDLFGRDVRLGGAANGDGRERGTLLFFLSPSCPVCNSLVPVLKSIRRAERSWLDIVLASDGQPEEHRQYAKKHVLDDFPYVLSMELGMKLQVGKLPYTVLIDQTGVIRAKGLANSREHLESLFEAKEKGVASIQEYMQQQQGSGEEAPQRGWQ